MSLRLIACGWPKKLISLLKQRFCALIIAVVETDSTAEGRPTFTIRDTTAELNNYPSGLTAYVPPDPTQVDSSQLDCEQSCKSTQLNYHKMTGFFSRPIQLESTQVIWTVDTLTSQLSSVV